MNSGRPRKSVYLSRHRDSPTPIEKGWDNAELRSDLEKINARFVLILNLRGHSYVDEDPETSGPA